MANDGAELPVLSISSHFSFSSLRISLGTRDGTVGGHCTGFLWERGGTLYLITNWHCVTAWHPIEDRCLDKTGFEPEIATSWVILSRDGGKDTDGRELIRTSNWLELPKFGRWVDVVAIKLGGGPKNLLSAPINSHSFKDAVISAGDEGVESNGN